MNGKANKNLKTIKINLKTKERRKDKNKIKQEIIIGKEINLNKICSAYGLNGKQYRKNEKYKSIQVSPDIFRSRFPCCS